jgi:hypothetical protein
MTNLTENEKQLLKIMNDNHDQNGCTFARDIRPNIAEGQILGLNVKGALDVLASLIKKGYAVNYRVIEDCYGIQECFVTQYMIEEGRIEDDITWNQLINR